MKKRKLGWTELEISCVGLGTWAMGGPGWQGGWGHQDDNISIKTIHKALELGINWIDTAPAYGMGHSEEVIKKALKTSSYKPIIATKCGLKWTDRGKIFPVLKKESVRQELEDSLKRLGVETIDLYQVHWNMPEKDIEEAWVEIGKFIKEGKVRYAGVSNFNVRQMNRANSIHPVASLQPPYSMLERYIEKEILPFCSENNIGVINYSPLQKGILTDNFSKEKIKNLPPDDHRLKIDKEFREPGLSVNIDTVNSLKEIAMSEGITMAQLAVIWTLKRSEVTSAIVGARTPEQVIENSRNIDKSISEETFDKIETILKTRLSNLK